MDQTARLSLSKPNPDPVTGDPVDITVINANFDKLDAVVGAVPCTSATRPSAPFHGQFARETDTGRVIMWDSASWIIIQDPTLWSQINHPTLTWSNTGVAQPALGNGALILRYKKVNRQINFMLKLFWGSTTTGGDAAGYWSFGGVPAELNRATSELFFAGGCWDTSAMNLHELNVQVSSTSGGTFINRMYSRSTAGALQRIGPNMPFVWASGDVLQVSGSYEAAS